MASLFEKTTLNGMPLHNRLVRSATWEGMCDSDGRPADKLIPFYRSLAHGGVGLIVSGYAFVRPEGKQLPGKMGVHTDAFAEEYRKLTHAVHESGGAIAMQLVHAGGQTDTAHAGQKACPGGYATGSSAVRRSISHALACKLIQERRLDFIIELTEEIPPPLGRKY